ncbi:MAG: glycosyltransferase family 2 protein, partial [Sphingobacteriaceae bacterium]
FMVPNSTAVLQSALSSKEKPFLTIAIPTYNRAALLEQCLQRLATQVQATDTLIEVIISNNASTDNTKVVASIYQSCFSRFRYVENETNIGADGNIAQAFRLAEGQYVWVFSDDDVLLPGYFNDIIALLQQEQPGLMHLSSVWHAGTIVPLYEQKPFKAAIYRDGLDYIRQVHHWATFITANIINKSLVANSPLTYAFPATNLVQLGWTLPVVFKASCNIVVSTPVIAAKSESSGDYKAFQTFATNFNSILSRLVQSEEIPGEVQHIVNVEMLGSELPRLLYATDFGRKDKYADEPVFRTLLINYWRYPAFWRNIVVAYLKLPVRPAWNLFKNLLKTSPDASK